MLPTATRGGGCGRARWAEAKTLAILELPLSPRVFETLTEAFGATPMFGLALSEADFGSAVPERQEMLMQTVHFLAAVQERLVAIMPVTVRLQ